MSRKQVWWTLVGVSCFLAACAPADRGPQISAAIQQILTAQRPSSVDKNVCTEAHEFYKKRSHVPAWVRDDDTTKAVAAHAVLRSAADHGLVASDYVNENLAELIANDDESDQSMEPSTVARLDVRITTALLALGHDVALGRNNPADLDPRWKKRRMSPDFVGLLARAAAEDVNAWLRSVQPQHPEYAALQQALASMRAQTDTLRDDRVRLLALNLERWRWMPDDFGPRHILVNVPAFHLAGRENGRAVLDMKVVVGEPDDEHRTPVFSGDMATVVFSPYWNVPESIVEGETAPALAQDPSFLERNNIEILRQTKKGTEPVDPSNVDWDDERELKQLLFRQRPGPQNALGHVKFLFPNSFNVYLHDTPADALFARRGRALSHGCVRLEQPEALAQYVLRDSPEWDEVRIREAMNAGVERPVPLKETVPVHIVYFTAWPRDDGHFDTWPDVYGYDARQSGPDNQPTLSSSN
jgi:murein L,D-transpeptidase YcbB/YkuD